MKKFLPFIAILLIALAGCCHTCRGADALPKAEIVTLPEPEIRYVYVADPRALPAAPAVAPVASPAAIPVVAASVAADPAVTKLDGVWSFVNSPVGLSLIVSVLCYLLKYLHDAKGLDTDRWVGLVHNIYNDAEDAGLVKNWTGRDKMRHAIEAFDAQFSATFGKPPTARDRQDLKNDIARLAWQDDSSAQKVKAKAA